MVDEKKNQKRNQRKADDDMINLVDNLNRSEDLRFNRRAFLKSAVGASLTLGIATLPFSIKAMMDDGEDDSEKLEIAKLSELPKGESMEFHYPTDSEPALLVHTKNGELKAYNNKCTHLQCPVFYEKKEEVLLCPCHRGFFNVNSGQPMAGPPQRELPKILLEVKGDVVYAVGREVRHG
ncbi:ubiquinol-cytochrome c reductase iron-sulfur subunit [Pontibacillus yanchengensis]|uniref:(2Fe-2S)-binding protein n=1 Tax=Pontibacillus yanchengensis Y32 TaxID=1385514 RepID=A0A0A2T5E1_9BACI|nr:Rieske 2Fe-2S domain-containing protein [Pontibacillus yanchengensis]KGP71007.1 (2Fe-2S)-binding protein [Pontibacillus yanchengensis Y32]